MPAAVMRDVRGDGAPKGILMVKKDKPPVLCNKSNKRRMARHERIFKPPIALEVSEITTVTYTQLRK